MDREYRFPLASVVLDDGRACAIVEFQLSFIPEMKFIYTNVVKKLGA